MIKKNGKDSILVVIDRFSNMSHDENHQTTPHDQLHVPIKPITTLRAKKAK